MLSDLRGPRWGGGGGRGSGPPENIGLLSNTGPDPLKITKLSSRHSMLGPHRKDSETPFKIAFGWAGR